jgi:colanic acid biosynthesis glycosyl transferase WcaI
MRVLFIIGLPCPLPGAAWTRIESFLMSLRERGHQAYVICSEKRGSHPSVISVLFKGSGILSAFSFFISTFMYIIRYKPDFVVISVPPGIHAFGASIACYLLNKRVIFDYRDRWEDYLISKTTNKVKKSLYRVLKFIMTFLYSRSTLTITVIPPFAEHLSKRGVRNVYILPNGADINTFKPVFEKGFLRKKYGLEKDSFILIYSGYIGKYYKLDSFIEALARLSEMNVPSDVRLVLIGEGEDLENILNLSKKFKIEKKIMYLGIKYNKKELAELIALADVGLIPYDKNPLWKEALPTKFFEYSSCGIPVIATVERDSLLARIIDKEKIGIHVEPGNVEEIVNAIIAMLLDKEFLLNASKRARDFIVKKFDRIKISNKFVSIIENLF